MANCLCCLIHILFELSSGIIASLCYILEKYAGVASADYTCYISWCNVSRSIYKHILCGYFTHHSFWSQKYTFPWKQVTMKNHFSTVFDAVLLSSPLSSSHLFRYLLVLHTLAFDLHFWHPCLSHFHKQMKLILVLRSPSIQKCHRLDEDWDQVNTCILLCQLGHSHSVYTVSTVYSVYIVYTVDTVYTGA